MQRCKSATSTASTSLLSTSFYGNLNQISLSGTRDKCRCKLAFPMMSGFHLFIFYGRTMKVTSKSNMNSKRYTMKAEFLGERIQFVSTRPSEFGCRFCDTRERNFRPQSPKARLFILVEFSANYDVLLRQNDVIHFQNVCHLGSSKFSRLSGNVQN